MAKQNQEEIRQPVDEGYLIDWFINSVCGDDPPVWTEEHIRELCADFDIYPKERKEN